MFGMTMERDTDPGFLAEILGPMQYVESCSS